MSLLQAETESASRRGGWGLAVVSLAVLGLFGVRTISQAAFWTHLAAGRAIAENGILRTDPFTFTAEGQPWVNGSWLYDRLLFGAWSLGGAPLVILLHVALVVVAFALLVPVARRFAGPAATALALLWSAWLLSARMEPSPLLVSLFLAALFIWILSAPERGARLWVLVPLQVLWANLHGAFLLGPAIVGLYTVEYWRRNRDAQGNIPLARVVAILLLCAVAGLLNPYGVAVFVQAWRAGTEVAFAFVQEWVSPFSQQFRHALLIKHAVTLALLLGAVGLITEKRKLPLAVTTLAVLGAFLAVRSLRHIEVFALLAFPFLALSFTAGGRSLEELLAGRVRKSSLSWWPQTGRVAAVGLALVFAAAILSNTWYAAIGSASTFGLGVAGGLFPEHAARVMERPEFPRRFVHLLNDGGYLAWRLPDRRIFVDHRADLYGAEFFRQIARCLNGEPKAWEDLETCWQPEAVLLNGCSPGAGVLLRTILARGGWALAYFDGTSALLLRAGTDHRELIGDVGIQQEGLRILEAERQVCADRSAGWARPRVSPRLIGAAAVYLALGRLEEARALYHLLARLTPGMDTAWWNLGLANLQLGRTAEAVAALQQAVGRMPRNALAWVHLGQALAAAGRTYESEAAFARARRLSPGLADRFLGTNRPPAAPSP